MPVPTPLTAHSKSFYRVFNPPLKFTFFCDSGESWSAVVDMVRYSPPDPEALSTLFQDGFTQMTYHLEDFDYENDKLSPDELNRLWNDALAAVDYYLDHLAELEGTPDPEQVPSNEQ